MRFVHHVSLIITADGKRTVPNYPTLDEERKALAIEFRQRSKTHQYKPTKEKHTGKDGQARTARHPTGDVRLAASRRSRHQVQGGGRVQPEATDVIRGSTAAPGQASAAA